MALERRIVSKKGRSDLATCVPQGGLEIIKSTPEKSKFSSTFFITSSTFSVTPTCSIDWKALLQASSSNSINSTCSIPIRAAPIPSTPFPAPRSTMVESEVISPNVAI